jgi:transposase
MAGMFSYPKAAVERAMKIQEVLLRAMAGKITWWQAEILGFSDRHLRRIRERYQEFGYESMFDKRRGQPSPKRVPFATVEKVLALYREKYFDLNVRHFHEKLGEQHDIDLSYTWVKSVLQGAGLVARQRQRGAHRKRRARRPLPGMLLHIDGSHHQWFQDERWYDLIVILDDATSEIYYAQLTEEESTLTVMVGLKEVIARKGVSILLLCAGRFLVRSVLTAERIQSTFSFQYPFRGAFWTFRSPSSTFSATATVAGCLRSCSAKSFSPTTTSPVGKR